MEQILETYAKLRVNSCSLWFYFSWYYVFEQGNLKSPCTYSFLKNSNGNVNTDLSQVMCGLFKFGY